MVITDANITINVKDMDRSITFYKSLGFKEKARWGNHYAQIAAPGITIGIHPSKKTDSINSSDNISIGLTVDNFEEAFTYLENIGIKTNHRKETGGEFLHFSDPDGTALYFIKPKL